MNILVIPTWYPNGEDKLIGIYHKEFCEALGARDNINVNMLYIDRQRISAPLKYLFMKKKEVIEEKNYKVYLTKMFDLGRISFDLQLKRYVKKLEKAFEDYLKNNPKPDVLHAEVTIPAGYAAVVLGEKYNIPVVVTEHATYFKRFFKDNNKKYGEYVLKHAYFTSVSKYMLDEIPNISDKKAVIPNLVDTEIFKNKPRKKIKGIRIAKVSALRQGKKLEDLFATVKIIVSDYKFTDILVTVVGDGFLEDYYKNKCHELGVDKYVKFVGRKTKEEIADILTENNIFVISSDNETFCIPGIEALASGMPVVSTKCLGPEEYLDSKCGKLVPIGDVKAMSKAIMDVYNNLDKYDIKYLRSVADRYSAKNVTDKAIAIYKELIK